jgi:hypothetical protein
MMSAPGPLLPGRGGGQGVCPVAGSGTPVFEDGSGAAYGAGGPGRHQGVERGFREDGIDIERQMQSRHIVTFIRPGTLVGLRYGRYEWGCRHVSLWQHVNSTVGYR